MYCPYSVAGLRPSGLGDVLQDNASRNMPLVTSSDWRVDVRLAESLGAAVAVVVDDVGGVDRTVEVAIVSGGGNVDEVEGAGTTRGANAGTTAGVDTVSGRWYTSMARLPPQYSDTLPLQGMSQLVAKVAPFFSEVSHQHSTHHS